MGLNPPNADNSRRAGDQICTYLNYTYPYVPAASAIRDRSRSRPPRRNYTVAEGPHLANHSPNLPLKGCTQPHHSIRRQSHYSYVPASQSRGHVTVQDRNRPTLGLDFSRDQRKRQAPDHKCSEPVGDARAASRASITHAVAMTFVPKQPAKRAITFESSLFQRNDPSVPPSQSEQHMPLSELNISLNIPPNRYLSMIPDSSLDYAARRTNHPRSSVHKPPLQSCAHPPRPSPPPLASHPSRCKHDSEHLSQLREKDRDVVDKALPAPRGLSRASAYPTRSTRK
ncbi:hypothetical protein B0J17DRAFT_717205 [Rhizoctonia solani]|nr:hypothetical protein B0J17DRAFT_717205 [Rhizoctonia solani]